ncbi:Sjoegren syndrome/scleroderma autoantigen 1 [Chionoecetes opilio]|uniref:Sjoegren syndrome/scleroderma autoantigen 1 n=1 Tax=Chionoecetes opilio TaxID=41210 RepID=A0A8J4Y2E1_CHIOP|nr:Sjoegren syndrome/scleroderma autoantigen 1 [Chionoecetes opilio]
MDTLEDLEDEFTWTPPSESELKVIEARRDRNNKISALMGQYLLKGYKMLATCCPVCDCVLLEDRVKEKFCVGCLEVDADTKKDNPAVSEEAARGTVQEIQHRHSSEDHSHISTSPSCSQPHAATHTVATSTTASPGCQKHDIKNTLTVHGMDLSESAGQAVAALRDKLAWATGQLSATSSVHEAQNLAGLITETCKAITALKEL